MAVYLMSLHSMLIKHENGMLLSYILIADIGVRRRGKKRNGFISSAKDARVKQYSRISGNKYKGIGVFHISPGREPVPVSLWEHFRSGCTFWIK